MAFVRKKRVQDKEYYQLVENYRENGKHRQRVLVHLGKHPTLESMIKQVSNQVDQAMTRRDQTEDLILQPRKQVIQESYSRLLEREWGGEIPTSEQISGLQKRLERERYGEEAYPTSPAGLSGYAGEKPTPYWRLQWYLKTEFGIDVSKFYRAVDDYRNAVWLVDRYQQEAQAHGERLAKLEAVAASVTAQAL